MTRQRTPRAFDAVSAVIVQSGCYRPVIDANLTRRRTHVRNICAVIAVVYTYLTISIHSLLVILKLGQ